MKSTTLSCLLILGVKRCMFYCLLVCGGHISEFLVSKFVSPVKFVNVLKIAHKHPQACWKPLPIIERRFGSWSMDFITGLPTCATGCNAIFTCLDRLTKYTVLTACTFRGRGVECQTGYTVVFLGFCQTVWPA